MNTHTFRIIRRIIGITALVLWGVALVPGLVLPEGVRPVWQLDSWATLFALILTVAYAILLIIHFAHARHWAVRLAALVVCAVVIWVCSFGIFLAFLFGLVDRHVWGNKEYVVYYESHFSIDEPDVYVLYQRNGFLDRRLYAFSDGGLGRTFVLGDDNLYGVYDVDYTFYKDLNLIECNADINPGWQAFDTTHVRYFYRLEDGQRYDDSATDSLARLTTEMCTISHNVYTKQNDSLK